MVGVVPKANVQVTQNADKLKVVNPNALILRHACTGCGVHMHGPVERPKHAFEGLVFIHPELSNDKGWAPPGFAAFVSSIIEAGARPERWERSAGASRSSASSPTTAWRRRSWTPSQPPPRAWRVCSRTDGHVGQGAGPSPNFVPSGKCSPKCWARAFRSASVESMTCVSATP